MHVSYPGEWDGPRMKRDETRRDETSESADFVATAPTLRVDSSRLARASAAGESRKGARNTAYVLSSRER